ncbi:hypothetical protein ABT126_21715 [Streptomyces sp. NPDC002012]|uniref:hypothetical protein n=1 Tax=unclassified Streptomyces TaxID=2593676 RepID=UPI0033295B7A
MTGWTGRTAVEIADAVRRGDVTPRQVVVEHLERIRRLDERLGAFRTVLDEWPPQMLSPTGKICSPTPGSAPT